MRDREWTLKHLEMVTVKMIREQLWAVNICYFLTLCLCFAIANMNKLWSGETKKKLIN